MGAEAVFQILNLAVVPWWGIFLLAPRSRLAKRAASHAGVFLALGLVYGVLLAAALATPAQGGLGYDGLRSALAAPLGFLAGWTHFLVFDLFVGAWLLREALRIGVEPRPYLLFTLLAGPIGLAGFLVRRWLRLRSLGQLGDVDLI